MSSQEEKTFINDCKKELEKNNPIDVSFNVEYIASSLFVSYSKVRNWVKNILNYNINHLDELWESFNRKLEKNNNKISWAIDYNILIDNLTKLLRENKIKEVNIFESRLIEEVGLNKAIANEEIKINYQTKKCVIVEPLYAIEQTSSIVLNFNSNIERDIILGAEFKIFIIPINKIIKQIKDIEPIIGLLSINKHQSKYLPFTTILTPKESDGKTTNIFVIDNSRTNLLELTKHRSMLCCIECDACKKVCPVYSLIKDEPYNNVFTGPVANVILPFMETIPAYKHLSFSCTLCGNCQKVCPVNIPIRELIIQNKNLFTESKCVDYKDRVEAKLIKTYLINEINKQWIKKCFFKFHKKHLTFLH
ncbi:MAG: 4Fe-4S dicluster domain-containing protein [Bacteroidales bacterium]|jgi:L-lactate utilization protein LutB|nr:4Fe-4S dicluster domain-containing protein [Bacteroidales bacterium]